MSRIHKALIRIPGTTKQRDTKRNKKNLAESWLSVLEPGGQPACSQYIGRGEQSCKDNKVERLPFPTLTKTSSDINPNEQETPLSAEPLH